MTGHTSYSNSLVGAGIRSIPKKVFVGAAGLVAVAAAAATTAAPADADTTSDAFLDALNKAGVGYNNPVDAVSLGQTVCPMLVQPGQSFASVASSVGNNGISPAMASFFTGIAISAYCPSMVSSIGDGTFLDGDSGMPNLSGIGIPGLNGFQIPGL
ncbi:MAG: DUF732 domain-containing protein [Mycobacterium sp.]